MRTTTNAPAVAMTTPRVLVSAVALMSLPIVASAKTPQGSDTSRGQAQAAPAQATRLAQADKIDFNIPKQSLADALAAWSKQSGLQVLRRDNEGADLTAASVNGKLSPAEALEKMLAATGLTYEFINDRTVRVAPARTNAQTTSDSRDGKEIMGMTFAKNTGETRNRDEQSEPTDGSDKNQGSLQEVVVTGTHIRGAEPIGTQLITIDREQIERTGFSTTPQLIQSIPLNSGLGANEGNAFRSGNTQNAAYNNTGGTGVNLRGLGPSSTLVLVNGRRIAPSGSGTFVDVSLLPLGAIERVEIVPDGASALYGSDAIGGVVNFILRKDYDGAETAVHYGHAQGSNDVLASQLLGWEWSTGNLLFSYEFNRREALFAQDREYYTEDLRRFGGSDFRGTWSNPGTIDLTLFGGNTYAIPAGQDGSSLTANQLIAGAQNREDRLVGATIMPEHERHSVVAAFSQDLSSSIHLFAEGYFSRKDVHQRNSAASDLLIVPATNAFFVSPMSGLPFVPVAYSFADDLGTTRYQAKASNYLSTLGVDVDLPRHWTAQVHASYGADDADTLVTPILHYGFLEQALADADPATAFNPFGDGSHTNPATLARLRGFIQGQNEYVVETAAASANGGLFALPGGEVKIALGIERREESLESSQVRFDLTPTPVISGFEMQRHVNAAYAELRLPLVGEANRLPGVHTLELSAAGRYENYSDFGSSTNPRLGVTWAPVADVRVRGSWGKSFQAPLLMQVATPPGSSYYFLSPLVDPSSPTGRTLTLAHISTGNADLKAQTATTWSVGIDIRPSVFPGARIGLNYFDIDYEDLINSAQASLSQALALEDIYAPIITRNPSAELVNDAYGSGGFFGTPVDPSLVGAFVDAGLRNLGKLREQGIDLAADWTLYTGIGTFTFQTNLTYLLSYDVAQTNVAPLADLMNTLSYPVDLRARGGVTWNRGEWTTSLFVNHIGNYENNAVTPSRSIDSWITVDLRLAYAPQLSGLLGGIKVALEAHNVLDADPPFVNNPAGFGYDPVNASPLGRYVAVRAIKSW